jgi:PAS domain S-box-containing protein
VAETDSPVVLVVDDNEAYVEAQTSWLSERYEVREAYSGEAGVAAYDEDVDVVILDRRMPDVPGDEVAERLRSKDGDVQILMTTAVEPDTDIIELGIDDYVRKPATQAELERRIEEALERRTYDDSLQGYFSLANKRDVLAEKPSLRTTEQFSELSTVVDEMAREQLQLRERQLQTLVEFSPAAIVTLDEDGKVDIWNPAATELFGWTASEVVGEEPPMFSSENVPELEYARKRLFRDAIVRDLSMTCRNKDGSTLQVSLSAAPLVADSEMYGTLFVFMDITDEKQRAQQITVMNRVLRHNLRNGLNTLMGWLIELDREADGELTEYTEKSLEAARELDRMADKARTIQHTLSEDRDIQEMDFVDVVAKQLEDARESYPKADIEADLPDEERRVVAITGIDEAIWELLENAIIHNDSSPPRIRVRFRVIENIEGRWHQLTIEDNGVGIPDEERAVLSEETESKLQHGSGLGLWYVTWLVDRSDGRLAFSESQFEDGTAVQIRLHTPPSE